MTDPMELCGIPATDDPISDELALAATVVVAAVGTLLGGYAAQELMRRKDGKERER